MGLFTKDCKVCCKPLKSLDKGTLSHKVGVYLVPRKGNEYYQGRLNDSICEKIQDEFHIKKDDFVCFDCANKLIEKILAD